MNDNNPTSTFDITPATRNMIRFAGQLLREHTNRQVGMNMLRTGFTTPLNLDDPETRNMLARYGISGDDIDGTHVFGPGDRVTSLDLDCTGTVADDPISLYGHIRVRLDAPYTGEIRALPRERLKRILTESQ